MRERSALSVVLSMLACLAVGCLATTPEVIETQVTVEVTRVVEVTPEATAVPTAVAIPAAERVTLYSPQVDRSLTLHIALPPNYASSHERYSVLYLLDGKAWLRLSSGLGRQLKPAGAIPRSLVVASFFRNRFILVGIGDGIDWTGDLLEPQPQWAGHLAPTVSQDPEVFGSAEELLTVLKKCIIPHVDAEYRTNAKDRTLGGPVAPGILDGYILFPSNGNGTTNLDIASSPGMQLHRQSITM